MLIDSRRKLSQVKEIMTSRELQIMPENLGDLLSLLKTQYLHPLRLVMVRIHDELHYTGVTYTTTKGVKLHEAVFLPSL